MISKEVRNLSAGLMVFGLAARGGVALHEASLDMSRPAEGDKVLVASTPRIETGWQMIGGTPKSGAIYSSTLNVVFNDVDGTSVRLPAVNQENQPYGVKLVKDADKIRKGDILTITSVSCYGAIQEVTK